MKRPRGGRAILLLSSCLIALPGCVGSPTAIFGEVSPPPPGLSGVLPQVQLLVVDDEGNPMDGVEVAIGDGAEPLTTDADGMVWVDWRDDGIEVTARRPGYQPATTQIAELSEQPVELALAPMVLRGKVVTAGGDAVPDVAITLGEQTATTGPNGAFSITYALPGEITASRVAWQTATLDWNGRGRRVELELQPQMVRGLHVSGSTAGDEDAWSNLLDLVESTELNSVVVDIKDESGGVFYESEVATAVEVGAQRPQYDLRRMASEVERRDLYLVGRIVAFQDPLAAQAIPDMAIYDRSTREPYNKNGQWFLDPTDPAARAYALDLAEEACRGGFDEIQFDYVRFPDGFPRTVRFDGRANEAARVDTITSFLSDARQRLHPLGCAVAADIFGFIISIEDDGGIGQRLEELAQVVDVVSPMVYPSHYSTGWFGKECPNDHPHDVVSGAMDDGLPRLPGTTIMRPWIQDFDGSYACGGTGKTVTQLQSQMQAVGERGLGYMVWNVASDFTTGAFPPG